ncbi:MAG: hypothetical protein CM1200mP22_21290 [Dehalococcoidia bacterium]|nr:MAG: hypothetical protein CM1200mP22_21290 [Dehalococcoidia bacterium]
MIFVLRACAVWVFSSQLVRGSALVDRHSASDQEEIETLGPGLR